MSMVSQCLKHLADPNARNHKMTVTMMMCMLQMQCDSRGRRIWEWSASDEIQSDFVRDTGNFCALAMRGRAEKEPFWTRGVVMRTFISLQPSVDKCTAMRGLESSGSSCRDLPC